MRPQTWWQRKTIWNLTVGKSWNRFFSTREINSIKIWWKRWLTTLTVWIKVMWVVWKVLFVFMKLKILTFQINNTINFTITSFNLEGNLLEYRPMYLSDLNMCNLVSTPIDSIGDRIRFAENFHQRCRLNLRSWLDIQKDMKFMTIFLNYFENNINFIQTVPVLIKNAYGTNRVRFFNSKIWLQSLTFSEFSF